MKDEQKVGVKEEVVLSKYEGDPVPENEFERVHVLDGKVVRVEQIENGEIVAVKEVD